MQWLHHQLAVTRTQERNRNPLQQPLMLLHDSYRSTLIFFPNPSIRNLLRRLFGG
jgi:hypothetical protein